MIRKLICIFICTLLVMFGVYTLQTFNINIYQKATNFEVKKTNLISNKFIHQQIGWNIKYVKEKLPKNIAGKGIKIAVFDTGFNFEHPDFSANIKEGFNSINSDEKPNDDSGHGTSVIGIISANDNDFGIVGVAPDAEIYPIKVLNKYGEGDLSAIVKGIDWCIKNKIQIINMSFSRKTNDMNLQKCINKATDAGIIVVASAFDSYGSTSGYPASYKNVISVTAVGSRYLTRDTEPIGKIDFCAPGISITTTSLDNGYIDVSGTSFAAPHITGLVALILSEKDLFHWSDKIDQYTNIYNILKEYSMDLGDPGKDNIYGEGFVKLHLP